ncbi:hypothetical protein V6Z12_D02G269200 [Gossypium hirsutum]
MLRRSHRGKKALTFVESSKTIMQNGRPMRHRLITDLGSLTSPFPSQWLLQIDHSCSSLNYQILFHYFNVNQKKNVTSIIKALVWYSNDTDLKFAHIVIIKIKR